MGSENTLNNNRANNHRQAIKRQFRAPVEMVKAATSNEQSDVVKELGQRSEAGFTEEQLLRLLAETAKRVAQSYGIKV